MHNSYNLAPRRCFIVAFIAFFTHLKEYTETLTLTQRNREEFSVCCVCVCVCDFHEN